MAAPPPNLSRTSTLASQESTTSSTASRNAALLGASSAFGRSVPRTRAPVDKNTGTNGALAAAFNPSSGSANSSPRNSISMAPPLPLYPNSTGGSMSNGSIHGSALGSSPIAHLGLPPPSQNGRSKSPSQQAAWLAAARAPAPTHASLDGGAVVARAQTVRRPAVAPKPRRLSENRSRVEDKDGDKPTDSTSIAPTTSLVDLFERKNKNSYTPGKRPEPIVIKPSKDLPIKSPKPVRTSSGITSIFQMELEDRRSTSKLSTDSLKHDGSTNAKDNPSLGRSDSRASPSGNTGSSSPLNSSIKRTSSTTRSLALDSKPSAKRVPSPSPLRSSITGPIDVPKPPSRTAVAPLEMMPAFSTHLKSIPAQYHELHPRRMTPNMTGDQLANAMVAGSLASSRAPSPKKMEPPPPPPRRLKHHHTFGFARNSSPTKTGMKQTLRKTASDTSDDDEDDTLHPYGKHKKKRLVRKHPNKHHEGDRKRWRDAVTERERKRYEGVWAANKGLHCFFSRDEEIQLRRIPSERLQAQEALQEQVSNIIARDLWSRSRLPEPTLEMVWDLIDSEHVGRLGKEEFVVGMWLIDQRLKGRKLPVKVSETVWASVRSLQGIKIRK